MPAPEKISMAEVDLEDGEELYYERTWKDQSFFAFCRRFAARPTALVGLFILLLLIFCAIFAPWLSKYDYMTIDSSSVYLSPSAEHIFGTDGLGRDLFTRVIYGGRYSLAISLCSEGITLILGIILGSCAGYFGGNISNVILRLCDILQSMPSILLAICVSVALGGGVFPTIIALSISGIPSQTRMMRATMLTVRGQEFVEAAQAIGCSKFTIIYKHVVPNCLAASIVNSTMALGTKIITSASLSFLGLGIQEPLPEWGALISYGKDYFRYYPYLAIIPGIVIAVCVMSYNLIGDGVRDALDPKLKS